MTQASTSTEISDQARELLRGAIDVHVHFSPDPYTERRMDARELARQAHKYGMAGLVLKSHEYPTQPLAWALSEEFPELRLYGAIALDWGVGGLNPEALRTSLRIGAKVVWFPTFDSGHWRAFRPDHARNTAAGPALTVLDDAAKLLPVCHELLDLIQEHDAVLASGHLSPDEARALLTEARRRGIRSIITHASFWIPTELQVELAGLGCYVEQVINPLFRPNGEAEFPPMVEQVRAVGADRVILATDLGQAVNPDPPVGMGMWIDRFLGAGFSVDEVGRMVRTNPAMLLDADD